MLAALIPVVWVVLVLAFAGSDRSYREGTLLALTVVHATAVISTELLSIPKALSPWPVAFVWTGVLTTALWLGRDRLRSSLARLPGALAAHRRPVVTATVAVFAVLLTGTLLSALLYPTTNYDSLTYHLPRVFFWLQRQSVQLFPTPEGRQLFSSTLVEYLVLHLRVLSGGFRLANVVQWASYLHVIIAASLIARRLGADRYGQLTAAMVAATTPMAVLQASTTQNDLASAMWGLTALYWMLCYLFEDQESSRMMQLVAAGASVGLAIQAKSTSYLLLAPFMLWAALALARRARWRDLWRAVLLVLTVVALLNAGTFFRNSSALRGDVLALNAPGNDHILIEDRSPEAMFTNMLKNSAMLVGTPSASVNTGLAKTLQRFVSLYGGEFENVETKEQADRPYEIGAKVTNHDVGPAPLTLLTVVLSLIALLLLTRRESDPEGHSPGLGTYILCATVALALLASLIKWNPFINRVLLGALLLWAPLPGVAVSRVRAHSGLVTKSAAATLLAALVLWASAVMLLNTTNRLLPYPLVPIGNRDLGWWNTSYEDLQIRVLVPEYERPIQTISEIVRARGALRVGLRVQARNVPIYPLLAAMPERRFAYVGQTVLPRRLTEDFSPEVIVEVVWTEDLSSALADGTARGMMLSEPLPAGDVVFLTYTPGEGPGD